MKEHNKVFLRECALYIKGEVSSVKLRGDSRATRLFAEAISSSRKFYLTLQEGDFNKVIPALKDKRDASKALREQTGYIWPL